MDNASRQIVNKAWNFAHVQTLPPFSWPPINVLDPLRGVAAELKVQD
jgi:hypothetical protein